MYIRIDIWRIRILLMEKKADPDLEEWKKKIHLILKYCLKKHRKNYKVWCFLRPGYFGPKILKILVIERKKYMCRKNYFFKARSDPNPVEYVSVSLTGKTDRGNKKRNLITARRASLEFENLPASRTFHYNNCYYFKLGITSLKMWNILGKI